MREIKFRARRVFIPNEWVYGSLLTDYKSHNHDNRKITAIAYFDGFQRIAEVIPETVGQFTGLSDKNGKEIYEGDIVEFTAYTKFREQSENRTKVVTYSCEPNGRVGFTPMVWHTDVEDGYYNYEIENIRIIGNVHENPELLEEK